MIQNKTLFNGLVIFFLFSFISSLFIFFNDSDKSSIVLKNDSKEFENLNSQIVLIHQKLSALREFASTLKSNYKAEINALKRQIDAYAGNKRVVVNSSTDEPELSSVFSDDEIEYMEEQQEDLSDDTYRTLAQEQYDTESRDKGWAEQHEQNIINLMDENPMYQEIALSSLECRSSSCRVVFDIPSELEPHVELSLVGHLGGALPHAVWEREGNQLTLILSQEDLNTYRS